jgi:predicted ATPase
LRGNTFPLNNVVKVSYSSKIDNKYQDLIKNSKLQFDENHKKAFEKLEKFLKGLNNFDNKQTFIEKIFKLNRRNKIKGIYLYGGIGSGVNELVEL